MNKYTSNSRLLPWLTAVTVGGLITACGGGGGDGVAPATTSAAVGPTGEACSGADCVPLGTAANYVILASTGISTTGTTAITGNIGLSPAAGSFLTGWNETANGSPVTYSTSALVAAPGKLYAADYSGETTSVDLTTAVGDMQTAYTAANGMAPAGGGLITACPGAGALGGLTITPGVYNCTVDLLIGADFTLSGAGVYVIRTSQNLSQASGTQAILASGAVPQNIFWVVAGNVNIGTTATMQGVILGKTLINLSTGATANGRLLAQTAVTLDAATVTVP